MIETLLALALLAAAPARGGAPPTPSAPAGPSAAEAEARAQKAEAEAAAATKAAQEVDAKVVQIQQQVEQMAQTREAAADLRKKVEDLEQAHARTVKVTVSVGDGEGADGRPTAGWDEDGPYLRSPDGQFLVHPMARIQSRFEANLVDGAPGAKADPNTSSFSVRRAKLGLKGHFLGARWKYRLQMELAGAAGPYLEDAYVEWWMRPTVALRAGQYKVPLGFQRYMSTGRYEFVDRSVTMNAFDLDRDIGLWVVGQPLDGRLQYQLGVMNGSGKNRLDDNVDKAYVARILAQPLGKLPEWEGDLRLRDRLLVSLGGGGYYNLAPTDVKQRDPNANDDVDADGRVDNVGILQLGGEARVLWRGAALQGEAFWRREDPGIVAQDRTFRGGYGQASYFVLPGALQLGARAALTDLSLYGKKREERLAAGTRSREFSGVISWYLRGHDLKLQADYSYLTDHNVISPTGAAYDRNTNRLRVQMQIAF